MPAPGQGSVRTPINPAGITYNWGFGNQGDLTAFRDTFNPDRGYFSPNYPLVPTDKEPTRVWDFPVGYNAIWTPRSFEPVTFWELRALANP